MEAICSQESLIPSENVQRALFFSQTEALHIIKDVSGMSGVFLCYSPEHLKHFDATITDNRILLLTSATVPVPVFFTFFPP